MGPAMRQALGETHGQPLAEAMATHLAGRRALLVLDNFEHVLEAAPLLVELLARCPKLMLLVTSRAALRVRGAHELPVPVPGPGVPDPDALGLVASVALFVERARAVAGFRLSAANSAVVAAVCRRLEGLPLALELAAPWLRVLTAEDLLVGARATAGAAGRWGYGPA